MVIAMEMGTGVGMRRMPQAMQQTPPPSQKVAHSRLGFSLFLLPLDFRGPVHVVLRVAWVSLAGFIQRES